MFRKLTLLPVLVGLTVALGVLIPQGSQQAQAVSKVQPGI